MNAENIPESVLVALEAIRSTGDYNMMQRTAVINEIAAQEEENWETWGGASNWLYDNPNRYMEALRAMGQRRRVFEGKGEA